MTPVGGITVTSDWFKVELVNAHEISPRDRYIPFIAVIDKKDLSDEQKGVFANVLP